MANGTTAPSSSSEQAQLGQAATGQGTTGGPTPNVPTPVDFSPGGAYGLDANQAVMPVRLGPTGLAGNWPGANLGIPFPGGPAPVPLQPGQMGPPTYTGGPPVGEYTITLLELEQEFWSLDTYTQLQIERKLWDAGFFPDQMTASASQRLKSPPDFGSPAIAAEVDKALANAATDAYKKNARFDDNLNTTAQTGPGVTAPSAPFVPGVMGHGPNEVVDLRNPNDVAYTAQAVFEKFLGRTPTKDETDRLTQMLQSEDFIAGKAHFQASETTAEQDFQQKQFERNQSQAAQQAAAGGASTAAAAGTTATSTAGGSPQQVAMAFFMGKGLSPAQAAGIVGNLQQESNIDPNAPGGGIAQWIGDRWTNLVNFAAANGTSPNDFQTQLNFLWQELNTSESGSLTALRQTNDPAAAAQSFSDNFERPGTPMMQNRIQYAQNAMAGAPAGAQTTGGTVGNAFAQSFISSAESQVGVNYVWSGEAPGAGFDCSGLVQWAMKQNGIDPGRTTTDQWLNPAGSAVGGLADAQPGDLLFFDAGAGPNGGPGHVGIYLGGGQMLDADHQGDVIGIRKNVAGYGNLVGIKRFNAAGSSVIGANDQFTPGTLGSTTTPTPTDVAEGLAAQGALPGFEANRIPYGAHTILGGVGIINNMIKAPR